MVRSFIVIFFVALSFTTAPGQNTSQKKNARPAATPDPAEVRKIDAEAPVYFYDFEKPDFLVSKIHIQHDENGLGLIRFRLKKLGEEFTSPITLSAATVEQLKKHWTGLDFLSSTEEYQSGREYPHLGSMKLKMEKKGKTRTAGFNWTENPEAKALTDEYKKIGYEYVWRFEIEVARKNQPLESPRLVKRFQVYLNRGEISDPPHIVPFLLELSGDERMPLIARNHAQRLAESIKKVKKMDN